MNVERKQSDCILGSIKNRFGRKVVFELQIRILGQADLEGELIAAIRQAGAKISGLSIAEIDEESGSLIYEGITERTNPEKESLASWTNKQKIQGTIKVMQAAIRASANVVPEEELVTEMMGHDTHNTVAKTANVA